MTFKHLNEKRKIIKIDIERLSSSDINLSKNIK